MTTTMDDGRRRWTMDDGRHNLNLSFYRNYHSYYLLIVSQLHPLRRCVFFLYLLPLSSRSKPTTSFATMCFFYYHKANAYIQRTPFFFLSPKLSYVLFILARDHLDKLVFAGDGKISFEILCSTQFPTYSFSK
jgi:hypothetical protein